MGVLTNHIPLLTGLDTGLILVRKSVSSQWTGIIVTGGFALVNDNKVTILVNEAELGSVCFIMCYIYFGYKSFDISSVDLLFLIVFIKF